MSTFTKGHEELLMALGDFVIGDRIMGPFERVVAALKSLRTRSSEEEPRTAQRVEVCCHKCRRASSLLNTTMIVCSECGNKRCPKASDHRLDCTGSNEPGQAGSVYAEAKGSIPSGCANVSEEAIDAALNALAPSYASRATMRIALEAAAPLLLAEANKRAENAERSQREWYQFADRQMAIGKRLSDEVTALRAELTLAKAPPTEAEIEAIVAHVLPVYRNVMWLNAETVCRVVIEAALGKGEGR